MFSLSVMELNIYISICLFILSLVAPFLHIVFAKVDSENITEILLKYTLFFNVGCLFFSSGLGQLLYPQTIASELGWKFSEFQMELAFSELSLGLLGLMCNLFGYEFWISAVISAIIWLLGSSFSYFYYGLAYGISLISKAAFVIYWNIFIALWLMILVYNTLRTNAKS